MRKALFCLMLAASIASGIVSCRHAAPALIGTVGEPVDLGLSVLWADHNLGASIEHEHGTAMQWGDSIKPHRRRGRDKARMAWGKRWRMPTIAEVEELMDSCQWTWRKQEPNGYIVTGRNGNSVFFPYTTSGYWTAERKPTAPEFAMYMYFNSAYPALSYTEPVNDRLMRPVTRRGKDDVAMSHVALAETLQSEQAEAAKSKPTKADVLELSANRILPLAVDSIAQMSFVDVKASEQDDGYHIISTGADCLTMRMLGVCAFSFRVMQIGTEKSFVTISYRNGDKTDEFDEEIEVTDAPYDIPAVITDPNAPIAVTIRARRGRFAIISVNMLHSYSKREMEIQK